MNGMKTAVNPAKGDRSLTENPQILIIGAGIAGISCGEYLTRNGLTNFKILEATDRTGGRIWSVELDNEGGKAEMGANWIHGIERNPIYKIADQNHLLQLRNADKSLRHKDVFITEDGEMINDKVVKEVDWVYGMTIQECEEFYQMGMPTPGENDSVGEYLRQCIDEQLEKYSNDQRRIRELIVNQRISLECCVSGCNSLNDLSLSEYGSYEELPGIHYTIPPGFESVLEVLKKNIPQENMVLNTPVKCINWNQNNSTNNNEYGVCVELENGEKMYANHVVVTVSVGVLKANAAHFFNPQLPIEKLRAIDHIGFGVVNKVMLEFDEQIVDPDVFRIELLWDKTPDDDSDLASSWFKKIYSFEVDHEHVLIGWLSGREAMYIESLTEEQIGNDCVAVLKKFLKKDIPKPKRVIRTTWGSNQYTRGAYSYVAVGGTAQEMETLGEPLIADNGKAQVLFAGEATHKSFYSTTHGALLTGQREAQRIIDIYSEAAPISS
ncbi:peroxisomal N(1)-acetyl-spermine/spermidine oxidase-like isoform X2 [Liolophura sinensis]|uniref:peroxisomal N(1)-acetyl-spermine/spermidine oxidase-like isoform X2 n=1 Tax=Liolophura sinensis TaxID=3198878 RepID=UPI003157F943